jgi:hypothetical protein
MQQWFTAPPDSGPPAVTVDLAPADLFAALRGILVRAQDAAVQAEAEWAVAYLTSALVVADAIRPDLAGRA